MLFLVIIGINILQLSSQESIRNQEYSALEPGQSYTGKSIAIYVGKSVVFCSLRCFEQENCELFQHPRGQRQICTLIEKTNDGKGDLTVTAENNGYRMKGCVDPPCWPVGVEPVLYYPFDSLGNIQLMEGTGQGHFSALGEGKNKKALVLDHTKNQWVNLGILSEACIAIPDTCGPEGAAVSFWVRVVHCTFGGVVSSRETSSGGFTIVCDDKSLRFDVVTSDHAYSAYSPSPHGWQHVVLNYLGPGAGQGVETYRDGVFQEEDRTAGGTGHTAHGQTVIGKMTVDTDAHYTSMEIDDLAFFNTKLNQSQIVELYHGY